MGRNIKGLSHATDYRSYVNLFKNINIYDGTIASYGVCLDRNMSAQSKQIYLTAKGNLYYSLLSCWKSHRTGWRQDEWRKGIRDTFLLVDNITGGGGA